MSAQTFLEGYRNGKLDKLLGHTSRYVMNCTPREICPDYKAGYVKAQRIESGEYRRGVLATEAWEKPPVIARAKGIRL